MSVPFLPRYKKYMLERPTPKIKQSKGNNYHGNGHIFQLKQNSNRVTITIKNKTKRNHSTKLNCFELY